jgi:hypothetical protein
MIHRFAEKLQGCIQGGWGGCATKPQLVFPGSITQSPHDFALSNAKKSTTQPYFETHDVFLMPAGLTAAYPHDHSGTLLDNTRTIPTPEGRRPYFDFINWQVPASLTGLPSTARRSAGRRADSPSAFRLWDRSSRTARRFPSPSC